MPKRIDGHTAPVDEQFPVLTRREFLKKTAAGAGVVATTMIIGGCGKNSPEIGTNTAEQKNGSISVNLAWGSAEKETAKNVASTPAGVVTVRIIVSGSGIANALQKDFPVASGSGTIDGVPVGTGRTLTAQGLDSSGAVTFQGTASNITVQAGQTTNVGTITLIASANSSTLGSFSGNIVLGSPTLSTIKANIFSPNQGGMVYLAYGTSSGFYNRQTPSVQLVAGSPVELAMDGLSGNTRYYYRLYFQTSGGGLSLIHI